MSHANRAPLRRILVKLVRPNVPEAFRFDGIEAELKVLDVTRFLDANPGPLRLQTL
jgi:hypothetical protein